MTAYGKALRAVYLMRVRRGPTLQYLKWAYHNVILDKYQEWPRWK